MTWVCMYLYRRPRQRGVAKSGDRSFVSVAASVSGFGDVPASASESRGALVLPGRPDLQYRGIRSAYDMTETRPN